MHSFTEKNDTSLDKSLQKNMSRDNRKRGVVDQVKYIKRASERKWTDREYHFQYKSDVAHKDVKNYCDKSQFPVLPFCGTHPNPHGARRLINHCHLHFDPKLGHGMCALFRIPCACVGCTSIMDKTWISGILSKKQARYQHVTNCTTGQLWDHIKIGISLI